MAIELNVCMRCSDSTYRCSKCSHPVICDAVSASDGRLIICGNCAMMLRDENPSDFEPEEPDDLEDLDDEDEEDDDAWPWE